MFAGCIHNTGVNYQEIIRGVWSIPPVMLTAVPVSLLPHIARVGERRAPDFLLLVDTPINRFAA